MKKAQHHQAHGHAKKHTHHKKHIHHHRHKHHPVHHKAAHHAHKAGHVKTVGHHPKRHLSLGEVACCAAEALAASLRLAGASVSEADVLALYWRTASAPGDGASLLDTLRAAQEHGLAGWRPVFLPAVQYAADRQHDREAGGIEPRIARQEGGRVTCGEAWQCDGQENAPEAAEYPVERSVHGLILGLQLPGGSHALTLDACGCCAWSWGELYGLDELGAGPAEEAWAVSWS